MSSKRYDFPPRDVDRRDKGVGTGGVGEVWAVPEGARAGEAVKRIVWEESSVWAEAQRRWRESPPMRHVHRVRRNKTRGE